MGNFEILRNGGILEYSIVLEHPKISPKKLKGLEFMKFQTSFEILKMAKILKCL